MALGAGLEGAFGRGQDNYAKLLQLDQAMRQMKQQRTAQGALGDYLQSLNTPAARQQQTPYPGTPSVPMVKPGKVPSAGAAFGQDSTPAQPATQPQSMSLEGLMSFLKDRGITGEDAYATASQFEPWLQDADKAKLGQLKFQVDMEKLLIASGWDQTRAKLKAQELAEKVRHDKATERDSGARNDVRALDKKSQQLTIGRQALSQRRSDIVNAAKNAGRALTPQEQAQITDLNARIQKVDVGMAAIRSQQALMLGGQDYGTDLGDSAADSVDTSDITGGG